MQNSEIEQIEQEVQDDLEQGRPQPYMKAIYLLILLYIKFRLAPYAPDSRPRRTQSASR